MRISLKTVMIINPKTKKNYFRFFFYDLTMMMMIRLTKNESD